MGSADVAFAVKVLTDNLDDFEPIVQQAMYVLFDELRGFNDRESKLLADVRYLSKANNLLTYRQLEQNATAQKVRELEKENAELKEKVAALSCVDSVADLQGEVWKDIEGYEGLYQVSTKGRVKSFHYGKMRTSNGAFDGKNYMRATLRKDGNVNVVVVHRLVALAFIPNPENKSFVNHIDGNKLNNCVENLEWVTCQENTIHAFTLGLRKPTRGTKSGSAKFTEEQVQEIRRVYKPRNKDFSASALAKKFKVSRLTIEKIIRNETYKDVK